MNAHQISQFSQSIAWHPQVAIGGLMVLISIARWIDIKHKEEVVIQEDIIKKSIQATYDEKNSKTDLF